MAHRLGITQPLGHDYSLALGTYDVTLLEMAGVYASFADDGRVVHPYAITWIKDRNGHVLYNHEDPPVTQAASPGAVSQLVSMMESVIDYGTGKGARLDRPAAGKTGTSSDFHDAWFMGFTGDYTTGVWIGNDDNSPMRKITGGSLPVQVWRGVMNDAEHGKPVSDLSHSSDAAAPEGDQTEPPQSATTGMIDGLELSEVAPSGGHKASDADEGHGDAFTRLINGLSR
jgi:penicillin-binding protein 1A